MKNAKGFYTKSLNMRECEAQGKVPYANIAQSKLKGADIQWKGRGVEWHHNGNYIAFFVNNKGDVAKIRAIKAELKEAEKAQKGYCYKSKAEAMRIVANLPQCKPSDEDLCNCSDYIESLDSFRNFKPVFQQFVLALRKLPNFR